MELSTTFVPSSARLLPSQYRLTDRQIALCHLMTMQQPSQPQPITPTLSRRSLIEAAMVCAAATVIPQQAYATIQQHGKARDVLYDSKSGSFVPPSAIDDLLRRDAGRVFDRCIVAGEIHDNLRTHHAQLSVIDSARRIADGRQLIVGFEQFYRDHDAMLDDYVQGNISLDTLLLRTNWDSSWGFDRRLYEPIFVYCRTHGITMRGLNVPRSVTHEVALVGLDRLSKDLSSVVPRDMDLSNMDHLMHFLRLVVPSHDFWQGDLTTLERYYQVQVLWEEFMGESVARTLQSSPESRMVALIGASHVEGRFGFPDRIEKRCKERPYTIVPRTVMWRNEAEYLLPDIDEPERGTADLMWYTAA